MSTNEGPTRSDFKKAAELPACGAHCEHVHGDQADPDFDELVHLRSEVERLKGTTQELEIDRLRAQVADLTALTDLLLGRAQRAESVASLRLEIIEQDTKVISQLRRETDLLQRGGR